MVLRSLQYGRLQATVPTVTMSDSSSASALAVFAMISQLAAGVLPVVAALLVAILSTAFASYRRHMTTAKAPLATRAHLHALSQRVWYATQWSIPADKDDPTPMGWAIGPWWLAYVSRTSMASPFGGAPQETIELWLWSLRTFSLPALDTPDKKNLSAGKGSEPTYHVIVDVGAHSVFDTKYQLTERKFRRSMRGPTTEQKELLDQMVKTVIEEETRGLFVWGEPGTGKSTLAPLFSILLERMTGRKAVLFDEWNPTGAVRPRFLFDSINQVLVEKEMPQDTWVILVLNEVDKHVQRIWSGDVPSQGMNTPAVMQCKQHWNDFADELSRGGFLNDRVIVITTSNSHPDKVVKKDTRGYDTSAFRVGRFERFELKGCPSGNTYGHELSILVDSPNRSKKE